MATASQKIILGNENSNVSAQNESSDKSSDTLHLNKSKQKYRKHIPDQVLGLNPWGLDTTSNDAGACNVNTPKQARVEMGQCCIRASELRTLLSPHLISDKSQLKKRDNLFTPHLLVHEYIFVI